MNFAQGNGRKCLSVAPATRRHCIDLWSGLNPQIGSDRFGSVRFGFVFGFSHCSGIGTIMPGCDSITMDQDGDPGRGIDLTRLIPISRH